MKLASLPQAQLRDRLRTGDLAIRFGPYLFAIESSIPLVANGIQRLYADNDCIERPDFADFHVKIKPGTGLHRWVRTQVLFEIDGLSPFAPLPQEHAFAVLEWAMNWCIGNFGHSYVMVHAACLEREGYAAILPGAPGAGKSTLCAGLVTRGWRLLSDEFALLSLESGQLQGLARAISLKNNSIDIIRALAPDTVFGEPVHNTIKGTINFMKAPLDALERIEETAKPGLIVFPCYESGSAAALTPVSKEETVLNLGRNAFNYSLYGADGFDALVKLVDKSDCYRFIYGSMEDAVAGIESALAKRLEPINDDQPLPVGEVL